ncbi:Translocator protein homolog [Linum perenne]
MTDKLGTSSTKSRREKRMIMAKRGLWSLAIALGLPLSLTFLSIHFLGSGEMLPLASSSFWFPPLWVVHAACITSTVLMGLAGWLVWADGGFHRQPTSLYMYGAQMGLSSVWVPVVFGLRIPILGLFISFCLFGALMSCARHFRCMSPTAGDLVKPCVAWAGFLIILNLKLV